MGSTIPTHVCGSFFMRVHYTKGIVMRMCFRGSMSYPHTICTDGMHVINAAGNAYILNYPYERSKTGFEIIVRASCGVVCKGHENKQYAGLGRHIPCIFSVYMGFLFVSHIYDV